jgi:hypothetical protein
MNATPPSIAAALARIERTEQQSRTIAILFSVIVSCLPVGLFFAPPGQAMMNIALITLILYNTLLLFWVKRDISTNAARILRALQATLDATPEDRS